MIFGELLDIHRFEVRGTELEHLRPQEKIAAAAGDVAEFLESEQAAPRGRRRNPGTACNIAETQGRVLARECADHGQSLGESSHGFAARRRCFADWHGVSLFRYPKSRKPRRGRLTLPRCPVHYSFVYRREFR